MVILTLILTTLAATSGAINFAHADTFYSASTLQNKLRDFTSDGCSSFPNGLPYLNPKKWLHCCVEHDVAYWQGGTAEDRQQADAKLKQCVQGTSENVIGFGMYYGVRLGGLVSLSTSWHWGYGWVTDRGYRKLTPQENQQVLAKLNTIPKSLDDLKLVDSALHRTRESLTGNYCIDIAAEKIKQTLNKSFDITTLEEQTEPYMDGIWKTFLIQTTACESPIRVKFHTFKPETCTTPTTEPLARYRIRFKDLTLPTNCH